MTPFARILSGMMLSASITFAQDPSPTPAGRFADQPSLKEYDPQFLKMHEDFLKRAKSGPIEVLFLGDSITASWRKVPEVWAANYEKLPAANFGIGGDRTENVLWRIDNGELDGIDPKVVVLLIGTNNTAATIGFTPVVSHTAPEITAGIQAIISRIQAKLPKTKILLLGIFPRGPRPNKDGTHDDAVLKMEKIRAVNQALAKLDNGTTLRYLDLTPKFLSPDGTISPEIMPDRLHPNVEGYKIWAASMQPLLSEMLAEPEKP